MPRYKQRYRKWFDEATPVNAVKAGATIGAGDNGTIDLEYNYVGLDGNDYTIEVVLGDGNSIDLSASLTDKAIVVTLATDGVGTADDTANTATLIATELDTLSDDLTITASGTGATALDTAEAEQSFAGGQYATECGTPSFLIINGDWYTCTEPVSKYEESGWKSATPTAI